MKKFKFIDLFAWLGWFHIAAESLGWECVFASEIDDKASDTYEKNLWLKPHWDITKIKEQDIPSFDMLCAWFPCQPFSKWWKQKWFDDTRGTLFFDICRIADFHKPSLLLLENVQNLSKHDNWHTYDTIISTLNDLGYITVSEPLVLSPEQFWVPSQRKRLYIPCIRKDLTSETTLHFDFNMSKPKDAYSILDMENNEDVSLKISDYEERVLIIWDEFLSFIKYETLGFPIWYDYLVSNSDVSWLPLWKKNIISKNNQLYVDHKDLIDSWKTKYNNLDWLYDSHKKFEFQAWKSYKSVFDWLIQFRPSGVRVRKPNAFSTLVAMNQPQIVWKYRRRLSINETKKLQSFPSTYELSENKNISWKQLWNSVNITVVTNVMKELLKKSNLI